MSTRSIVDLLKHVVDVPPIRIVDVGANSMNGQKGVYQSLVRQGAATIVGFEPDPAAFAKIDAMKGPGELFIQKAVGDGKTHHLRICAFSGMNSLLEPNFPLLDLFHFHGEWARVVRTVDVETVRLDDVAEVPAIDYLKIDIQGGELMVFEHAEDKLADCLVVQTECMLVPMYVGQPLLSEQEFALREHGLMIHKFAETSGHALKPFKVNGDGHNPLSQLIWVDVVFIKDITKLHLLSPDQILKMAIILHDIYGSIDVVHLCLKAYDKMTGADLARIYLGALAPAPQTAPRKN